MRILDTSMLRTEIPFASNLQMEDGTVNSISIERTGLRGKNSHNNIMFSL
jgi:hypothetical protein